VKRTDGKKNEKAHWIAGSSGSGRGGLRSRIRRTAAPIVLARLDAVAADFAAFIWLLQHVSPAVVATHAFVNPVVAIVAGWAWAGEPLGGDVALATAAIVAAVVLIQRGEGDPDRGRLRSSCSGPGSAGVS